MTTFRIPGPSSSVASDLSPSCSKRSSLAAKNQDILHNNSPSERSCTSVESVESGIEDAFETLEISKAQRLSDALRRSALLVGGSLESSDRLSDGSERFDFSDRYGSSEPSMNFDRLAMSERTTGSRRYPVTDRLAQSERSFRSGSGQSTGSEKLLDNSSRLSFLMSSTRIDLEDDMSSSDESDMDEHHFLYEN